MTKISQKLPAKFEVISQFINSVIDRITSYASDDEIFNIKLALEEAITNAIRHGNKMDPNSEVFINYEISNSKIVIEVKDQGKGFDFKRLPNPTARENLEKLSGRGVFLIRSIMDKVDFSDGGSCIKMTKIFKSAQNDTPRL